MSYNLSATEDNIIFSAKTTVIEDDTSLKGLVSVTINNSFAINCVRVYAGENGLFVKMPQKKNRDGEYEDIVFPITKEAREQLINSVIDSYTAAVKIKAMSEKETEQFIEAYEIADSLGKPATAEETAIYKQLTNNSENDVLSKINFDVQLKAIDNDSIKAVGQITLNQSVVVKGVRVISGEKGLFVSMPNYQDKYGEYKDVSFPVTKECREQLSKAILHKYESITSIKKGVNLKDLGGKDDIEYHNSLNNSFAEKIMAALDESKIKYFAKIQEKTMIAINKSDSEIYKDTVSSLTESLKKEKEAEKAVKKQGKAR